MVWVTVVVGSTSFTPLAKALHNGIVENLRNFIIKVSRIFNTIQIELYVERKKDTSITGYKYRRFLTLN